MYESHAKRTAAERVYELKHAMISGAWANSNYDDGKSGREQLLKKIDEFAESAISRIYGGKSTSEYVDEVDMTNPFFAAMKVPTLETMNQQVKEPSG